MVYILFTYTLYVLYLTHISSRWNEYTPFTSFLAIQCLLDMKHGWTKNAFGTWITRKDINGVRLFHLSYLITLVAYLRSHWTSNVQIMYFMFDSSIYSLFVLNTAWKRDFFQMMRFINICSTCSMVQLKTRFETWKTKNDVNGVSLFHISYLITLMVWTQNFQIKYFMFDWSIYILFVLNRAWKRDSLQIMIFVYISSTWIIVELKTRFETWITRNDVNGVSLYNLLYFIILMAYLCSQRTPNVQIKYFMFDWSIYRLFVLKRPGNVILSKWWYS
jgi:hypothetical protein